LAPTEELKPLGFYQPNFQQLRTRHSSSPKKTVGVGWATAAPKLPDAC
jgi:hypothetical protein